MKYLDLKNRTGTIVLNSGHSMILGNKPSVIDLKQVAEKAINERQDIQSFGLFDNATPNYATYYPDVTAEDLSPKDTDFIYPVFRMLSETILSKGVPIDFSKKGVLKNSMHLMVGQTINIDHETALGNAIGAVVEVEWQNSYKTQKGDIIPAGFNAVLKIDGKSNPRIARGVMMSPPSIHSNSVTVRFAWEPSHKFENDNEFYNKLGTYDKDGSLVRLVVSDIRQYSETSLVAHGADPYAQRIGADGKIVNPDYAKTVYNFSADKVDIESQFIDYKDIATLSFSADTIPNLNNNNNNNHKNMDVEQLIAEVTNQFGVEKGAITVENFAEQVRLFLEGKVDKQLLTDRETELSNLTGTLGVAEGNVTRLEAELAAEKLNVTNLKATSMPEGLLTETREEAVRLYSLINGENAKQTIIESIKASNYDLAKSFVEQFQAEADLKFPDVCQDCHSTNISKATAQMAKDGDGDDDNKVITNSQARQEILKAKDSKKKSIALGYNQ